MNNSKEILPDWKFTEESIDDSLVKISAISGLNIKVEKINSDGYKAYDDCINEAFKIEQSIGKNRNKFLFDILVNLIDKKLIKIKEYHESAMGSWHIEANDQRVVLDGKDMVMWIDKKIKKWLKSEWVSDQFFKQLENLQYHDLKEIANKINNYSQQ